GQRAFHPSDHDRGVRGLDFCPPAQQAMNAGDADIVYPPYRCAHRLRGDRRFLRDRDVGSPRGDDRHRSRLESTELHLKDARNCVVACIWIIAPEGFGLVGREPSDQNRLLALPQRSDNLAQLLHRLRFAEHDLWKSEAQASMSIDGGKAQLYKRNILEPGERRGNVRFPRPHLHKELVQSLFVHRRLHLTAVQSAAPTVRRRASRTALGRCPGEAEPGAVRRALEPSRSKSAPRAPCSSQRLAPGPAPPPRSPLRRRPSRRSAWKATAAAQGTQRSP